MPSETFEDKLYKVDIENGLCECFQGFLKGPCKHKKAVVQKHKMKNFEVLPKQNEKMRAFYHFIGTGTVRESRWFRPLDLEEDEVSIPLADWDETDVSEDNSSSNISLEISNDQESMEVDHPSEEEVDESEIVEEVRIEALSRFRKSVFSILCKVESRFEQDANIYLKAINAFVKMA